MAAKPDDDLLKACEAVPVSLHSQGPIATKDITHKAEVAGSVQVSECMCELLLLYELRVHRHMTRMTWKGHIGRI